MVHYPGELDDYKGLYFFMSQMALPNLIGYMPPITEE